MVTVASQSSKATGFSAHQAPISPSQHCNPARPSLGRSQSGPLTLPAVARSVPALLTNHRIPTPTFLLLLSALENLGVSPVPPSPWRCYTTSMAQMVRNLPAVQETPERWVWSLLLGRSPGEGHSNPLQFSCLENSIDRGRLWVTVQGVAKSQTLLSDFHSLHFLTMPLNLVFPWWLWFYFY